MFSSLKFLHSMRESDFLVSALKEGLLLTDHLVKFALTADISEMESSVNEVHLYLMKRLTYIGKSWESLDETNKNTIYSGIGAMSGKIPMLCFTEVPDGREISYHQLLFGGYGLVVKRQWLEKNKADRVIYVGQNSTVSRHLFRNLANLRIANLFVDTSGQVLFDTNCFPALLDLMAYIEVRDNLEEFEWRIAGNHGFMGKKRDVEKRLVIALDDIEYVLVQKHEDVRDFEKLIKGLAISQSPTKIPPVLCQPNVIPT